MYCHVSAETGEAMKSTKLLKVSATRAIAAGVLLVGLASIAAAWWIGRQPTTAIKPLHVSAARSLGTRVAHVHEQHPLVFHIYGNVKVGLPNGGGVLAVVFSGQGLTQRHASVFHLFARGLPEPDGTLALDTSRFSLDLGKSGVIYGRATSFDSTLIGVTARSSSGVHYRGIMTTQVNAVTHRFSCTVTLRPVAIRPAVLQSA